MAPSSSPQRSTGPVEAGQERDVRPAVVYRLFAGDGALLYVGISIDLGKRLEAHAKLRPWWREAASAAFSHHPSVDSARAEEIRAIRTERPRYNVADIPNPPEQLPLLSPRWATMRPVLTARQQRQRDSRAHDALMRALAREVAP